MANWTIVEQNPGEPVGLWRGRKSYGAYASVEGARLAAAGKMESGDVLYHEAPDGYRTVLSGKRRGWRDNMK